MADVLALLEHPRRRAIACAAIDEPVTVGEIADRIDVADGAIRSMVERLARDGLLVTSEKQRGPAGKAATAYRVAEEFAHDVAAVCRGDDRAPLEANEELLLIPLTGLSGAARVLAHGEPEVVRWAARTRDPQVSLILGLRPDSPPAARDRLLLALRDQGVDCVRVHVGEPFTPRALFDYAAALLASDPPALPSGE